MVRVRTRPWGVGRGGRFPEMVEQDGGYLTRVPSGVLLSLQPETPSLVRVEERFSESENRRDLRTCIGGVALTQCFTRPLGQ